MEKYFLEKYEAVIPALYLLKRGLSSYHSAYENMIMFNSVDTSGQSTIIDDQNLHVDQIRDLTTRLQGEVERQLDRLLFHHPAFRIPDDHFVHDEPRCRTPDYGFLDDPKNCWVGEMTVIQYIMSTPDVFDKFAYADEKGLPQWKPGACHAYLVAIYNLQMDIFILLLLTFGAPGRGTELLSHLIRNVAGGSIRNVFVLFNLFTLRGSFNKTTHATLQDRAMVRIPLISIGRLVIRHLVFLRPLFAEWQRVFRPHMHFNATHFLFAGIHRPVVTADLSLKISSVFGKEFNIKMSLGRYRQWMAFMISCNRRIFGASQVGSTSSDDQIGHSRTMDLNCYSADMRFPEGVDRSIYMETARSSASAQLMFGHPPDLLMALCKGSERQNEIIETIKAITGGRYAPPGEALIPGTVGTAQSPGLAFTSDAIGHIVKTHVLPQFILHINRTIAQSHASILQVFAPEQTPTRIGSLQQTAHTHTHPFLLERLRHFRGMEDQLSGFTGTAQAEVTQILYDGEVNVGYFAATGTSFLLLVENKISFNIRLWEDHASPA